MFSPTNTPAPSAVSLEPFGYPHRHAGRCGYTTVQVYAHRMSHRVDAAARGTRAAVGTKADKSRLITKRKRTHISTHTHFNLKLSEDSALSRSTGSLQGEPLLIIWALHILSHQLQSCSHLGWVLQEERTAASLTIITGFILPKVESKITCHTLLERRFTTRWHQIHMKTK